MTGGAVYPVTSETARLPSPETLSWRETNRQHLYASLEVVRLQVGLALRRSGDTADIERALAAAEEVARRSGEALAGRSTLAAIADLFGLSRFERDVLLLAAGPKLGSDYTNAPAGPDRAKVVAPSFELAFRALRDPHWAAITPAAPLRRHHLVQLDRSDDPVLSTLRIDERILFFLLGLPTVDARLDGLIEPVVVESDLPASYERVARRVAELWSGRDERAVIQLGGPDQQGKRAIAAAGCNAAGLGLYAMRAIDAQCDPSQRIVFARLLDRELLLAGAALLVVVDDDEPEEARAARALIARMRMPVLVARRDPLPGLRREVRIDLEPLDPNDQRVLWRLCLESQLGADHDQTIDRIVSHFRFGPAAIRATADSLPSGQPERGKAADALWEACRRRGRTRQLSDLAQRIESNVTWSDLVLPAPHKEVLAAIASHLVHATTVHERWGFGARGARGLGLTALFSGESGTGKTLAAEAIANHVRLDLWRVDLSRMLDKYIGETEKNLRRIFDAAEETGAILLFDEADALFSKRTEVKDSVDRFTNVEVSYLLQRIETYGGLAILTTNLRGSLDSAFMRRIRFVVNFPFPKAEQRAQIWGKAFPSGVPTTGLNFARLAQLNMAGGNIRNVALNAAFHAAADGRAVGMEHLLKAARSECAKLERTLSDSEIAGWA